MASDCGIIHAMLIPVLIQSPNSVSSLNDTISVSMNENVRKLNSTIIFWYMKFSFEICKYITLSLVKVYQTSECLVLFFKSFFPIQRSSHTLDWMVVESMHVKKERALTTHI